MKMTQLLRFAAFFSLFTSACSAPTTNHSSPVEPPAPSSTGAPAQIVSVSPPTPAVTPELTADKPPTPPTKPSAIPTKELQIVQAIDLGKWPEGVTLAGDYAWIAESGQRRLAKVDLQKATVVAHVNVGRLPVAMATGPDDSVYSLLGTDQIVSVVNAKGVSSTLARVPDSPEDMVLEDGALWVLLWDKASSANSTVVRVDLKTRTQKRSPKLGRNAWQIAFGHERIWVGHEARISVLDPVTLDKKTEIALIDDTPPESLSLRTTFGRIAAGPAGIYSDVNLSVVRIDPQQLTVTHRALLHQLPLHMVATPNDLWVATREGSIWQLDPLTLDVRAEHKLTPRPAIHDLKVRDGLLYITDSPRSGSKEDGRLLVLRPQPAT